MSQPQQFSKVNLSPLTGGPISNIRKVLKGKHVQSKYFARMAVSTVVSALLEPFRLLDKTRFTKSTLSQTTLEEPPLFVIGHWRSGTTHLHNILSKDPAASYVTTFQTVFPDLLSSQAFIKPLVAVTMADKRPGDNVKLSVNFPQEEEFAITNINPYSYYQFMYFPKRYAEFYQRYIRFVAPPDVLAQWKVDYQELLKKATFNIPGRRLVLKNPANTGRIKPLLEWYPDARFIFIYRNPITVFLSTRRFFSHLLPALQLNDINEKQMLDLIFDVYESIMKDYLEDRSLIAANRLTELRFEDLEKEGLSRLDQVYRQLELTGFEQAKPAFSAYLKDKKGYKKNRHKIDRATLDLILDRWGFAMEEWKYDIPENIDILD